MGHDWRRRKFQFYLSSIKSYSTAKGIRGLNLFQFYLSSIKRQHLTHWKRLVNPFQFYLSSIKSFQSI